MTASTVVISDYRGAECVFDYDTIEQKINSLTRYLLSRNIPYQSRVAIVGLNSIWYFIALQAIRKAGLIAMPLHHNLARSHLQQIIIDHCASLLMIDTQTQPPLIDIPHLPLSPDLDSIMSAYSDGEIPKFSNSRISLVIFTSGSSGKQKGVALSEQTRRHFVIGNIVQKKMLKKETQDHHTTLISSPLSHILANNMTESLYALRESFVLMSKFDPVDFIRAIEKYKITKLSMVPSMWSLILSKVGALSDFDFSHIRHIYFSSEPLHDHHVKLAQAYFKNAQIENCYGISEVGPNLFGPHPNKVPRPPLSVGYPRKGIQYRLNNNELEIKSPFMFSYYINQTDLINSKFTQDGYYKTKDLFEVDQNGFYYYLGRADDMIIRGGKNIYPREIELAIESHPEIKECIVVALPDEVFGEVPYAFVVCEDSSISSEDDLKKHILNNYSPALIPRRIWFLDQIPTNNNLKVDLKVLRSFAVRNKNS